MQLVCTASCLMEPTISKTSSRAYIFQQYFAVLVGTDYTIFLLRLKQIRKICHILFLIPHKNKINATFHNIVMIAI